VVYRKNQFLIIVLTLIFLLFSSSSKCLLFPGGSSKTSHPGHMLYVTVGTAVDKNFVFRISTGNIEIDKSHLDQGSATNEVSRAYVRQLDDAPIANGNPAGTCVTGQVLGQTLGGGAEQQNLFPQSAVTQSDYKAVEKQIYDCLNTGAAHKAAIEWTFNYQTTLRTRPYSVRYQVHFFGESNLSSTCANIDKTFDN